MVKSKKSKVWIDIIAPKIFGGKIITKTLAEEKENVIGRTLEVPLISFIENTDKFFYKINLRINEVNENYAKTEIEGISAIRNYYEKMVQRGFDKLDYVKDVELADKKVVRVKVFAILGGKVNNSVLTGLRKEIDKYLQNSFSKMNFEEVILSIINDKINKELTPILQRIYPINFLLFREIKTL